MKLYVDAWDPSYGAPLETTESAGPEGETTAQVRADIEREPAAWAPLQPAPELRVPGTVLLVDGVRRIDARVWVEESDGTVHPGLTASYAAGVVRCDLRRGSWSRPVSGPSSTSRSSPSSKPGSVSVVARASAETSVSRVRSRGWIAAVSCVASVPATRCTW